MTKKLFIISCFFLFVFSNCVLIPDGKTIEIPCKVLDMQGNPLKGITLSLVSSDSLNLTINETISNEIVVKQKTTNAKGELTFTYEHSRERTHFIRGETQGKLLPLELFDTPYSTYIGGRSTYVNPIFHYDSLVPITLRVISTLPRMKNAIVDVGVGHNRGLIRSRLLHADFPISSNRLDTVFKINTFSQPSIALNCSLELQDTFRGKYITTPVGNKRDSAFTLSFQ